MPPNSFVEILRSAILDANLRIYRDLFAKFDHGQAKDPHWLATAELFAQMTTEQKEQLYAIVRQTMVDTVSSFLTILDGVNTLTRGDLRLLNSQNDTISGDLQDHFLATEESDLRGRPSHNCTFTLSAIPGPGKGSGASV